MLPFRSWAQVESTAFNLLLKSMLNETVPAISVKELANEGTDKFLLLDTREKKEFAVSHLKGAKWVGFETFDLNRLQNVPKDKAIVVYCSVGLRSEKVGEKLKSVGFTNVQNLYGSIFDWVNQGHPVYDIHGQETHEVHAYNRKWGIWLKKGEKVY